MISSDHRGEFVAAYADSAPEITVPELAEALAIRMAISVLKREGLDGCVIASDCLSVVQRIECKGMDRSTCGPVIQDIKASACSFDSISFRHVYRGQNLAAHCLARSSEFSSMSLWRGVPPNCIRETICIDSLSV